MLLYIMAKHSINNYKGGARKTSKPSIAFTHLKLAQRRKVPVNFRNQTAMRDVPLKQTSKWWGKVVLKKEKKLTQKELFKQRKEEGRRGPPAEIVEWAQIIEDLEFENTNVDRFITNWRTLNMNYRHHKQIPDDDECANNCQEMVELLLAYGFDINQKTIATIKNDKFIVALLTQVENSLGLSDESQCVGAGDTKAKSKKVFVEDTKSKESVYGRAMTDGNHRKLLDESIRNIHVRNVIQWALNGRELREGQFIMSILHSHKAKLLSDMGKVDSGHFNVAGIKTRTGGKELAEALLESIADFEEKWFFKLLRKSIKEVALYTHQQDSEANKEGDDCNAPNTHRFFHLKYIQLFDCFYNKCITHATHTFPTSLKKKIILKRAILRSSAAVITVMKIMSKFKKSVKNSEQFKKTHRGFSQTRNARSEVAFKISGIPTIKADDVFNDLEKALLLTDEAYPECIAVIPRKPLIRMMMAVKDSVYLKEIDIFRLSSNNDTLKLFFDSLEAPLESENVIIDHRLTTLPERDHMNFVRKLADNKQLNIFRVLSKKYGVPIPPPGKPPPGKPPPGKPELKKRSSSTLGITHEQSNGSEVKKLNVEQKANNFGVVKPIDPSDEVMNAVGHEEKALLQPTDPKSVLPEGFLPEGVLPESVLPEGSTLEGSTLEGSALEGSALEGSTLEGSSPGGSSLKEVDNFLQNNILLDLASENSSVMSNQRNVAKLQASFPKKNWTSEVIKRYLNKKKTRNEPSQSRLLKRALKENKFDVWENEPASRNSEFIERERRLANREREIARKEEDLARKEEDLARRERISERKTSALNAFLHTGI